MPRSFFAAFLLAGLLGTGCGSAVGDPCTVVADCGNTLCLNQEYTPGGYCSRQCTLDTDESCPSGSVCVQSAAAQGLSACLKVCRTEKDCRTGYTCRQVRESTRPVCVGPSGI